MQGSIIDTACAIAVGSREQSIDMGIVPLADIVRDGRGRRKPFSIELINCLIEHPSNSTQKDLRVTFDGDNEMGSFSLQGEASGIGLQISDSRDNVAIPGEALPFVGIIPGSMKLNYNLSIISTGYTLKPGTYHTSLRFKVDYF